MWGGGNGDFRLRTQPLCHPERSETIRALCGSFRGVEGPCVPHPSNHSRGCPILIAFFAIRVGLLTCRFGWHDAFDARSVRETGVGDDAWQPEDFEEEEEAQPGDASVVASVERAPSPATLSTETAAASQNKDWKEVQRLESAMEGAEQGNWRDLKTVFELAGIFPAKEGAASSDGG